MPLYQWNSEALKRYAQGDIIVAASSVDEARAKAEAVAGVLYARERFYMDDWILQFTDEDDVERYRAFRKTLTADLAREPEIIAEGVIFISGSE